MEVGSLEASLRLLDGAIEAVRDLTHALRPAVLDDLGIYEGLRWAAANFERRTGVRCRLNVQGDASAVPSDVGIVLFRIAEECLNGLEALGGVTQVNVRAVVASKAVRLQGRASGSWPTSASLRETVFPIVRERAESRGGSALGRSRGTSVSLGVSIPLPQSLAEPPRGGRT